MNNSGEGSQQRSGQQPEYRSSDGPTDHHRGRSGQRLQDCADSQRGQINAGCGEEFEFFVNCDRKPLEDSMQNVKWGVLCSYGNSPAFMGEQLPDDQEQNNNKC